MVSQCTRALQAVQQQASILSSILPQAAGPERASGVLYRIHVIHDESFIGATKTDTWDMSRRHVYSFLKYLFVV